MKHIKTFESKKNKSCWVYTELSSTTPSIEEIVLFDDEESAKNYFITKCNKLIEDNSSNDEDLVLTYEDALDYTYDNEEAISIQKVEYVGKFELSEKIKMLRNAKKYNL